tara:strand:+ start:541 stop:906 length:366 start_codon:yes stop_codon:yes gene_type:complete
LDNWIIVGIGVVGLMAWSNRKSTTTGMTNIGGAGPAPFPFMGDGIGDGTMPSDWGRNQPIYQDEILRRPRTDTTYTNGTTQALPEPYVALPPEVRNALVDGPSPTYHDEIRNRIAGGAYGL